jgi:hypothetical protein
MKGLEKIDFTAAEKKTQDYRGRCRPAGFAGIALPF